MNRKEIELNEWIELNGQKGDGMSEWIELNRTDFVSALSGNKDCPWQDLFTEKDVSF